MKITELVQKKDFTYSFEVTPDVSEDDLNKLDVEPAFISITWHAKIHGTSFDAPPLRLAKHLKSAGKEVLLHLSCNMLNKDCLNNILVFLQHEDICNLFVILGENYNPVTSDFKSTQDLVSYIKKETGDYFCIGVAGYPGIDNIEKLLQLKEKVNNGADFIITQAFFEPGIYKTFVEKCNQFGITVPILPAVYVFETQKQLNDFINMCKVKVSNDFLEFIKNIEEPAKGIEIMKKLIETIMNETQLHHFHFFTLNRIEFVSKFIKSINW